MSPPRRGGGARPGRPTSDDWPPRDAVEGDAGQGDGQAAARWVPWAHEPAAPIPVEGGVAATTRRGQIGSTWWSRRFLDALESVMVGGRMASGRAYARKGQVLTITVGPGVVTAPVQGSRPDPYDVRLVMPVVPAESWARIVDRLAAQAGYAARMLAGDLPHEVAEVFEAEGESLLPAPHSRLTSSCTCPDFENPCKHIAAVCYLLAEAFDRDPFELLAWRGRGREEILGELRARRSAAAAAGAPAASPVRGGPGLRVGTGRRAADPAKPPLDPAKPPLHPADFYGAVTGLADVRVTPSQAPVPDGVLHQLPRGVLELDGEDLASALAPAYAAFSAAAARRAVR